MLTEAALRQVEECERRLAQGVSPGLEVEEEWRRLLRDRRRRQKEAQEREEVNRTQIHMHACTIVHRPTHILLCKDIYMDTRARTHARTRARTRTRTHRLTYSEAG